MKFVGFRLPEGQIRDMKYIANETGMSMSQMVRQGLAIVINDFFQKEKVKQEHIQERRKREAIIQSRGGITLDGW